MLDPSPVYSASLPKDADAADVEDDMRTPRPLWSSTSALSAGRRRGRSSTNERRWGSRGEARGEGEGQAIHPAAPPPHAGERRALSSSAGAGASGPSSSGPAAGPRAASHDVDMARAVDVRPRVRGGTVPALEDDDAPRTTRDDDDAPRAADDDARRRCWRTQPRGVDDAPSPSPFAYAPPVVERLYFPALREGGEGAGVGEERLGEGPIVQAGF
ncbi:hypothetical protein B0H10DRAFT_1955493 [Mycena sp. CBHHK59/15]|nr:hypothetical protein B0H10DRAFT_1955493 [Mycena sp. CBHHK59/15]